MTIPADVSKAFPDLEAVVPSPPSIWQGMSVTWLQAPVVSCDYVGDLKFTRDGRVHECYVLELKYPIGDMLLNGESLGNGFFSEYVVAEKADADKCVHRLTQWSSITYSTCDEPNDYISLGDIGDPKRYSVSHVPRWRKKSQAYWLTLNGCPMYFAGQLSCSHVMLESGQRDSDMSVKVFWGESGSASVFKIMPEDTSEQTPEEHYQREEQT